MKKRTAAVVTAFLALMAFTVWEGAQRPQGPSGAAQAPAEASGGLMSPTALSLPNPKRTPGWASADVTPANIHSTICVAGYTKGRRHDDGRTVRPPNDYTHEIEALQLELWGYRDRNPAHYEEDHLIPLELGGDGYAELNLWPEPYAPEPGARAKDRLENRLHDLVCSGQLGLRTAQRAIAVNWWLAYQEYVR